MPRFVWVPAFAGMTGAKIMLSRAIGGKAEDRSGTKRKNAVQTAFHEALS